MKVLVTGGFGLVGKSLQRVVASDDSLQRVVASDDTEANSCPVFVFVGRKDADLRDVSEVTRLFKLHKPDVVVHLASCVGGVYDNMANNYRYLVDNLRINTNVVDACNQFGVKRLISCLSTCIFPESGITYPLTSDQLHKGLPHSSNIGYAFSKRILDLTGHLLANAPGSVTRVVNVTPTNLYGENDNYNLQSSHVIPGLIHKTYLSKSTTGDLTVYGSGSALRQFLYVDDLSRVILRFIGYKFTNGESSISCIVSPPESSECSIRDLVQMITEISEFTGKIVYDTSYADGQHKKTASGDEICKYFPDFQFTPLHVGLKRTIQYFENNYNTLRC